MVRIFKKKVFHHERILRELEACCCRNDQWKRYLSVGVVLRSGAKNYGIAKAACDKNRNIAKKRKIYCK